MNLKNSLLASGAFGGMTRNEQRLGRFIRDGEGHPAPAGGEAPAVEPKEPEVDPFDAAFAEHTKPVESGDPPAPAAPAASDPPAPAAPAAGDPPAPAGEPPAPAAGETPPAPAAPAAGDPPAPAAPVAPEPKAGLSAEDVLSRLADMVKPGETPAVAPTPEAPIYTEAEQTALDEYQKNWPDIALAETLRRRAEYADIFKFVFTEVAQYVQPLKDQLATMGNTLHIGELKAAVPDYSETLESDVAAWVDTQPAYLQAPYKHVMKNGTSEEVADLIGRYRATTGAAPAAPAPAAPAATPAAAPAVPAAAPKTELSSAAKQAAERLAPVSGDRSAVPAGEDAQDFDTAFSKYAAAGG